METCGLIETQSKQILHSCKPLHSLEAMRQNNVPNLYLLFFDANWHAKHYITVRLLRGDQLFCRRVWENSWMLPLCVCVSYGHPWHVIYLSTFFSCKSNPNCENKPTSHRISLKWRKMNPVWTNAVFVNINISLTFTAVVPGSNVEIKKK